MEDSFVAFRKSDDMSGTLAIDVSSYGSYPYNLFSPFTYSKSFNIPVPGQDSIYASSVESIWQGLKLIDNKPDFSLLEKKPKKRRGNVSGHLYKDDILDLVSARRLIYKPSYDYYLTNYVPEDVKSLVLSHSLDGKVGFYDVEENIDPENVSRPLAHSFFLASYFNLYLEEKLSVIKGSIDRCAFELHVPESDTLAEDLARAINYYSSSSLLDKGLIRKALAKELDSPFLKQRYYDRFLDMINEQES